MLESLRIRDFQAHRDLTIEFDPHITTIVGPTDVGKSSVLRALVWLLTNRPRGTSFLRRGGPKRVLVRLDVDGHRITRIRGKTNTYKLDGSTFQAFGSDVPDEIARILQVGELNVQPQMEAPGFWLALSPGEVSRKLNEIVDLSSIDSTLSYLSTQLRRARTEEEVISQRLESIREERRALKVFPKADRALQRAEGIERELLGARERRDSLLSLLGRAEEAIASQSALERSWKGGRRAEEAGERWERASHRRQELSETVQKLERWRGVAQRTVPDLAPLERSWTLLSEARDRRKALAQATSSLATAVEDFDIASARWSEARDQLCEDLGEECPLCGSKIES